MKQTILAPNTMPTAGIAVNKSRMKLYTKAGEMPTYYLQKGQEFQIELFNPTRDVVLAKISMNNTVISQGGLVLNPGQRVFLDRYLDVPKKFLFDTYEVSNTEEVKEAIANNGDIKVEFFREEKKQEYIFPIHTPRIYYSNGLGLGNYHNGTPMDFLRCGSTGYESGTLSTKGNLTNSTLTSSASFNCCDSGPSMDFLSDKSFDLKKSSVNSLRSKSLKSKSIETGRVEEGSHSDQSFKYVNKSFESWAFHTIEYKLLPVSQKVNTTEDINVKVYCTNCGAKLGKTDKFCANCGCKK